MREANAAKGTKIGTTGRGIGPAYEDRVGRRAIRIMDLADAETLPAKVERMLAHHNPLRRGLGEIAVGTAALEADLEGNWEVLGEAIQTVIRAEIVAGRSSIADPYAVLKDLTRGRRIGKAELVEFVTGLDIGQDAKDSLLALTPGSYTGASSRLVDYLN